MNHHEFLRTPDVLKTPVRHEMTIDGITFRCIDTVAEIEVQNPFITNPYDFQEGFYRGEFQFYSPLTGEIATDTPEAYGRHKIGASLVGELADKPLSSVIDLGCGTLDIARAIPSDFRSNIRMYNADISGPWPTADGSSALERGTQALAEEICGMHGFFELINYQYNFNSTNWPFASHSADVIVSNMALHHIANERKLDMARQIYNSLKPGGALILNDVYSRQEERAMLTRSGARGPSECKGYPISFNEAFAMFAQAGFTFDEVAERAQQDESCITEEDIIAAMEDQNLSMPISNSVWFTVLRKEEA